MYAEEPLDFEFEDPLFLTPTRPPNAKRRKVIGLDDLLTDHYKEEHKSAERIRQRDASNICSSDKNNDYNQTMKERVVSKLVDDCHEKVHAMGDEVEIPLWGLRVFGCQLHAVLQKEKTLVNFKELSHNCKLLQTLSQDNENGILELGIEKELAEGDFLESLLKNGWLFNLVRACGWLEEPLASWIFNQMLYSSNEELHSSACDFWCGILSSNKVNPHLIQLDWFPKYSEIKYALEDLNLSPSMPYFGNPDQETETNSAVTYIHLFESDHFSIGIFCLPVGSAIPLHNHPRMTVFSKLLFGSMHIKSYDWVVPDDSHSDAPRSSPRLAKVKANAVMTAPCDTSILYPTTGGNMHCFTAMTPCAVLDVLGPPYSDYEGRHCAYYNPFPHADVNNSQGKSVDEYAMLEEIEKPEGFSVHGAHYNGPSIFDD